MGQCRAILRVFFSLLIIVFCMQDAFAKNTNNAIDTANKGKIVNKDENDKQVIRIMPLGDSITEGYPVPGGYRGFLYNMLIRGGYKFDFVGSEVINPSDDLLDQEHDGHGGWTIKDIADNVDNWLDAYDPQVILLMIGTNDIAGNGKVNIEGLSSLIDQITVKRPEVKLIVASLTPLGWDEQNELVLEFNAKIPGLIKEKALANNNVFYANMYMVVNTIDLPDNIHPNQNGYRKMAEVWYKILIPILKNMQDKN